VRAVVDAELVLDGEKERVGGGDRLVVGQLLDGGTGMMVQRVRDR
jgi:hypothetical protein